MKLLAIQTDAEKSGNCLFANVRATHFQFMKNDRTVTMEADSCRRRSGVMKNAQQITYGQGHFKLTEILIYKKVHNNELLLVKM